MMPGKESLLELINKGMLKQNAKAMEVVSMVEENTGNQPEKKFSTGAISATVWRNNGTSKKTGEKVEFRTVSLQRRYTDKNGEWKTSNSMRVTDVPKATLVLQKAYEYLVLKGQGPDAGSDATSGEIEEIIM